MLTTVIADTKHNTTTSNTLSDRNAAKLCEYFTCNGFKNTARIFSPTLPGVVIKVNPAK